MSFVKYIVEWDLSGNPENLYRYIDDDKGYWAEYLDGDGKWIEDSKLFDLLTETHSRYYDDIGEEKALEIAKRLVGSIHN